MTIWITDDGTDLYYTTQGSRARPALLLLPGLLGATAQWQELAQALTADYYLLLTDLRGHGRSGNSAPTLQPERMLQDLVGLLDHLEISALHVAGYDFGGYLALMLALSQPRRVRTLLLHAARFYWTGTAVARMRAQLDPDALAQNAPAYADSLVQTHGARRWRELVRQAADLLALLPETGLTERMAAQVQCPVLVSVGDRDELVSVAEAQRLSRILPQGQLLALPGVKHSLAQVTAVPFLPFVRHFHAQQS